MEDRDWKALGLTMKCDALEQKVRHLEAELQVIRDLFVNESPASLLVRFNMGFYPNTAAFARAVFEMWAEHENELYALMEELQEQLDWANNEIA